MSIRELYFDIESKINNLKEAIGNLELLMAQGFKLPPVLKEDEHEHVSFVPVETIEGEECLEYLLSGLTDFWIQGIEESSKRVRRYPGVVVLSGTPGQKRELVMLVESVNNAKNKLKNFRIERFKTRNERFAAMHDSLPGVITEQLDRRIPFYERNILSVSYTWPRKHSLVKVDAKQLITDLKEQMDTPRGLFDIAEWQEMLQNEMSLISRHLNGDILRQRRTVKVHPAYNLLLAGDEPRKDRKKQPKASLPLILVQKKIPQISPLRSYDEMRQRKGYVESTVYETPLVPRLNLYAKKMFNQ